jgi:hypothetical protein
MSTLRAPLALAFFLGACGSKTPPASPPAAADATAVIADASPVAHPPAPQADAAPSDAAPADTVTPADTTPPGDTALAPEPTDTVAPSEEVAVAPAELEPGTAPAALSKDIVARLGKKTEGCVGLGRNGRQGLFIIGDQVTLMDLKDLAAAETASTWPLEGFQTLLTSDATVAAALTAARLVPCREKVATLTCSDPKKVMKTAFAACNDPFEVETIEIPKSVPITVADGVDVSIAGNVPVHIDTAHESFHDFLRAAYWADEIGTIVIVTNNQENLYTLTAIAPHHLGDVAGACLARPQGKKAEATPPAFTPRSDGCIAMSADGKHAAFALWEEEGGDNDARVPKGVQWFGEGPAPALDLTCLAAPTGCSAEAKAQLSAKAAELGLVGCVNARRNVTVDGRVVPVIVTASSIALKTPAGPSEVWRAKYGPSITAENEALLEVFQHPRGGPIFVYATVSLTPTNQARIYVLDEARLGYCAPVPGLVSVDPLTAISASSSAPDGGGYRFGAKLVADGDLASAWQPVRPKDGDAPAWIELALAGEETIASVEIANGFQRKDGNGDLFTANARIAQGTLTFSDGSHETITFAPDQRGLVRFDFAPRKTRTVRLTIDTRHSGARWANDLAVAEVRLFGPR